MTPEELIRRTGNSVVGQEQDAVSVDALTSLDILSKSAKWTDLDVTQRQDVLQQIEDAISLEQKSEAAKIDRAYNAGPEGTFDLESNVITLPTSQLSQHEPFSSLRTLFQQQRSRQQQKAGLDPASELTHTDQLQHAAKRIERLSEIQIERAIQEKNREFVGKPSYKGAKRIRQLTQQLEQERSQRQMGFEF